EERKAVLFADTGMTGNRRYDAGEMISSRGISPTPLVKISFLAPSSGTDLDIVFVPPKPRIYFNDNATTDAVAVITLQQIGTGLTKLVKVNRVSGQVGVE
ncbi:MAG: hypothetical protein AAB692_01560, partial [Patescibacteria group bacterium]